MPEQLSLPAPLLTWRSHYQPITRYHTPEQFAALAAAGAAQGRTGALAAALDDARALLSAATPLARQHVLRALLRPGAVVLGDAGLTATVALAAGQTLGPGCRSMHEAGDSARVTSVEFRLVA